jgi:hypothetical protein
VSKELLHRLTETYVKFFDTKNLAGIAAMLREDAVLSDPAVQGLSGRGAILDYVRNLYRDQPDLSFTAQNIWVDGQISMIEFSLTLGTQTMVGVDVIEWHGRQIGQLRAYLYPALS